jgi:alpha-glucosidase
MRDRVRPWWQGAVIYQIYPRSFVDANDDGVGDLAGITGRLSYVAGLGVDAVWLSPFFRSPMKDFGYDVSDYRDVDPLFGTLADFDALVARAHELGLKIVIDQVLSHTSDQHPWFVESRASRDNAKADWYVWADPQPDGSPPNNWLSVFGGSSWAWDSRRRQYYLHNFLASQPDLNFHNPEVTAQLLEDARFWLDRGVDGFRLDTVNFYFHDTKLRVNPPSNKPDAASATNPYGMQKHVYDKTRPENIEFLRRLRALTDAYDDRTLMGEVGETGAEEALAVMAEYTGDGDKLHMAYTFDLLSGEGDAAYIKKTVSDLEQRIADGWPCWAMSNHDSMRMATRWGGEHPSPDWIKAMLAALFCLRGSICLYQGDELGLPEADVPYEKLQDPYGINFWPEFKGRDGARTPMPWQADAAHAGFSKVEPWLPVDTAHYRLAADQQQAQSGSVLTFCQQFLSWRREHPALLAGTIRFIEAPDNVLAFWRESADEKLFVAINLGESRVEIADVDAASTQALKGQGLGGAASSGQSLALNAYTGYIGQAG